MIFEPQVADLEDEDTTDDFADEEEIEGAEEVTDPQEYFDNEEDGDDDEDTPLSECGKFMLQILLCAQKWRFASLLHVSVSTFA